MCRRWLCLMTCLLLLAMAAAALHEPRLPHSPSLWHYLPYPAPVIRSHYLRFPRLQLTQPAGHSLYNACCYLHAIGSRCEQYTFVLLRCTLLGWLSSCHYVFVTQSLIRSMLTNSRRAMHERYDLSPSSRPPAFCPLRPRHTVSQADG